jgi:exodeoxyribonuclease VII large subunit
MEDLWAFNEEVVARAIYRSEIPVISAVGHEPDVTIADYVADLRAATPSNGAELAAPDQADLRAQLRNYEIRMGQSLSKKLKLSRQQLELLKSARVLRSPTQYLENQRQRLDGLVGRLAHGMGQKSLSARQTLTIRQEKLPAAWRQGQQGRMQTAGTLAAQLDAMSPLKVLSRGYSITENEQGAAVVSASDLHPGEHITIRLAKGRVGASVDECQED